MTSAKKKLKHKSVHTRAPFCKPPAASDTNLVEGHDGARARTAAGGPPGAGPLPGARARRESTFGRAPLSALVLREFGAGAAAASASGIGNREPAAAGARGNRLPFPPLRAVGRSQRPGALRSGQVSVVRGKAQCACPRPPPPGLMPLNAHAPARRRTMLGTPWPCRRFVLGGRCLSTGAGSRVRGAGRRLSDTRHHAPHAPPKRARRSPPTTACQKGSRWSPGSAGSCAPCTV